MVSLVGVFEKEAIPLLAKGGGKWVIEPDCLLTKFRSRWFSCAVAKVKNLDHARVVD